MSQDWKWQLAEPLPRSKKQRKDAWALVDASGKVLARVYDAETPDTDGLTYCWAVWPYHQLGNVGGSRTGADARLQCEKRLAGGNLALTHAVE